MIPTLIIAAVVLPFIITFIMIKVAESHASDYPDLVT